MARRRWLWGSVEAAGWRGAGGATGVFKEGCRESWASVLSVDAAVIGGATGVFKEGCRESWASVLSVDAAVIVAAIRARERRIAQRTGVIRTRVELLEG
jgi:hypothetical protein